MAVKRFSNSLISQSGQDKVTNFIAGYSPAIDEMDLIERVVVGSGGTSSITFTNIPQTYQHLQLRMIFRSSSPSTGFGHRAQINGNTGSNYSWHYLSGTGTSSVASNGTSQTSLYIGVMTGTSLNNFTALITDILDYTNTSKNKVIRNFWGYDSNGGGEIQISSGAYYNTAAVTSFSITPDNSLSYTQHTVASLYGVIG